MAPAWVTVAQSGKAGRSGALSAHSVVSISVLWRCGGGGTGRRATKSEASIAVG